MNSSDQLLPRILCDARCYFGTACILVALALLGGSFSSHAQEVQPQSTPASTPITDPSPNPTATPVAAPTATPVPSPTATPGGTPQITITPGVPSAGEMEAYNAALTPQVEVKLSTAAATPGMSGSINASASPTASVLHPVVQDGVCAAIGLRAVANTGGKVSRNSSASGANPQPVATVTLTYPSSNAGQTVWVQMTRPDGGTLSATDDEGRTYSGEHGFDLTLNANGQAVFTYQAPNVSSTYQILTRFGNVVTALRFAVPDAAP